MAWRRRAQNRQNVISVEEWEQKHTLTTDRLVIRPVRSSDANWLANSIDAEVREAQGYDAEQVEKWRAGAAALPPPSGAAGCASWFAVCDQQGIPIGQYLLFQRDDRTDYELGWWLGANGRGRGLGRESLEAVLHYAHTHLGLSTVRMGTGIDNDRARKQIESTGAIEAGRGDHALPNGTTVEGVWYLHSAPPPPPT